MARPASSPWAAGSNWTGSCNKVSRVPAQSADARVHVAAWPAVLAQVDWQAPWYTPYATAAQSLARHCQAGIPLWEALNAAAPAPVRRVPQDALPAGQAYEHYIFDTGCCPTRAGLHDFFNGLCWSLFPATKTRLNQLQAAELARTGIRSTRGPLRDALTIFDENAAFLYAPEALWQALVAKDWQTAFGTLRPLWQDSQVGVFGHALLEKLVHPRKAHSAHVYRVAARYTSTEALDALVATHLLGGAAVAKAPAHLPLLGVPGWWAANARPAFYQDRGVFRAPGRAAPHRTQYPETTWAIAPSSA